MEILVHANLSFVPKIPIDRSQVIDTGNMARLEDERSFNV